MPSRYVEGDYKLVRVYVEGYNDVSFWRGIFDDFETDRLKFEINVPVREDLAKGKRVLLNMAESVAADEGTMLCVDSDFDYIFGDYTDQSRLVNGTSFLFHTYAYSTENYLCYPPSLHNICVKATKNDTMIFDFELFMAEYSRIIYPLFLWYAYSAKRKTEKVFTLNEFRSSVRLNYLDIRDNGIQTLEWLERQVRKRIEILERHSPSWINNVRHFGQQIIKFGATPENIYLFMQGHTLMDNVVMIVLHAVCEKLREMSARRISEGKKFGVALKNEISNYNNSLRNVREILLDNEQYKECFLYKKLEKDIAKYIKGLYTG